MTAANTMALAPSFLATSIKMGGIRLIERHCGTVFLGVSSPVVGCIRLLAGHRAASIHFDGTLLSTLILFISSASANFTNRFFIMDLSRQFFSSSCFANLATGPLKEGASTNLGSNSSMLEALIHTSVRYLRVSSKTRHSDKPFSSALLTTVWITETTFVSWLDSVARPATPKRCIIASSTKAGLFAICSCMVSSKLDDEANCVSQIHEEGRSFHKGLSATASNVSPPSALRIDVLSSSNASSNNRGVTGVILTGVTAYPAVKVLQPLTGMRFWLLTTITSSLPSNRLDFIISKFAKRKN